MTRTTFLELVRSGSDDALLDALWPYLPEYTDEDGWVGGDLLVVVQYADNEIRHLGFWKFYAQGFFEPTRLVHQYLELGAIGLAGCLLRANRVFPDALPPLRFPDENESVEGRMRALGVRPEHFELAEDLYLEDEDDLTALMAAHVRRNVERYQELFA